MSAASMMGAELVDPSGRVLPLRATQIAVRAGSGLARVELRQKFLNAHPEPLCVRYQLPLPADGAVVGFAFQLDGQRTRGVVKPRRVAREAFEQALLEGRSAALLEQDRSSLFSQELGNLPPGSEIEVEVAIDQPLVWLSEGAWSFRFPTVVGPRYLGAEGRTPDADRVSVAVSEGGVDARATLILDVDDDFVSPPESPSHPLQARGVHTFGFVSEEGVPLDRDLVVQWPVAGLEPGIQLSSGRPPDGHPEVESAFALLTVVPPMRPALGVPRDLILLVDVSGSMDGQPLQQAQRVLGALIEGLGDRDRLQMLAFSDRPRSWQPSAVFCTPRWKSDAQDWLRNLRSMGATEMRTGIEAALRPLRDGALRQVVVVTDGYIGFEAEVIGATQAELRPSVRLHVLGVGHGVNRSLTRPLARVGCGTELIVAPGEDAERHAARLLAATDAPQVTHIEVSGSPLKDVARASLPELYAGAPTQIPLKVDPQGGTLEVRGRSAGGSWSTTVKLENLSPGQGPQAPAALFARERVEDLEAARAAAGADVAALDAQIEALGLDFQVATRTTSWVALSSEATVDPGAPLRRELMPHALVAGVSPEGIGLRPRTRGLARAPAAQAMGFAAPAVASAAAPRASIDGFREAMIDRLGFGGGGRSRRSALPARPERRLRATVRSVAGGRVVLEVEVDGPLHWACPEEVVVEGAGRKGRARVAREQSTRASHLTAGQVFRLVLVADVAPRRVVSGSLVIEVTAPPA